MQNLKTNTRSLNHFPHPQHWPTTLLAKSTHSCSQSQPWCVTKKTPRCHLSILIFQKSTLQTKSPLIHPRHTHFSCVSCHVRTPVSHVSSMFRICVSSHVFVPCLTYTRRPTSRTCMSSHVSCMHVVPRLTHARMPSHISHMCVIPHFTCVRGSMFHTCMSFHACVSCRISHMVPPALAFNSIRFPQLSPSIWFLIQLGSTGHWINHPLVEATCSLLLLSVADGLLVPSLTTATPLCTVCHL